VEEHTSWALRPCSEKWEVNHRPCKWFRWGAGCQRRWRALIAPNDIIFFGCVYANLVVVWTLLVGQLVTSVSDSPRWSAYQRTLTWTALSVTAQGVMLCDVDGANGLLGPTAWIVLQGTAAPLLMLALIEVADAYRLVLDATRERSAWKIGGVVVCFNVAANALEHTQVPASGRPGCWSATFNFVRHAGNALIVFFVAARCLRHGLAVRSRLVAGLRNPIGVRISLGGPGSTRNAVDSVLRRLGAVVVGCVVILLWLIFVAFRNSSSRYICAQPSCSLYSYLITLIWVFFYLATDWVFTLALAGDFIAAHTSYAYFAPAFTVAALRVDDDYAARSHHFAATAASKRTPPETKGPDPSDLPDGDVEPLDGGITAPAPVFPDTPRALRFP